MCWVIVCFSAGEDVVVMVFNGLCCGLSKWVGVWWCGVVSGVYFCVQWGMLDMKIVWR